MDKFSKKRIKEIISNKKLLKERTRGVPLGFHSEKHIDAKQREEIVSLKKENQILKEKEEYLKKIKSGKHSAILKDLKNDKK